MYIIVDHYFIICIWHQIANKRICFIAGNKLCHEAMLHPETLAVSGDDLPFAYANLLCSNRAANLHLCLPYIRSRDKQKKKKKKKKKKKQKKKKQKKRNT